MIDIVEYFIQSKDGIESHCEDIITITDDFACVVDGATSKFDLFPKKSGRLAAEIISGVIPQLDAHATLPQVIQAINKAFEHFYMREGVYHLLKEDSTKRPSASFALYSKYHHVVWLVGDCQCLVDNTIHTNSKSIDAVLANTRAVFLELCLAQGHSTEDLLQKDLGRDFIFPLLEKQQLFLNNDRATEYQFTSLDGFMTNTAGVKSIPIDSDVRYIVLASDGYPELLPTLFDTEEHLQMILHEDPLCFRRYKSTKGLRKGNQSFDDRSYLKIRTS